MVPKLYVDHEAATNIKRKLKGGREDINTMGQGSGPPILALFQTRRRLNAGETTSYLFLEGADPAFLSVSKDAISGGRVRMQRCAGSPRDPRG